MYFFSFFLFSPLPPHCKDANMRRVLMLMALACRAATGLQLEESIPNSDEFLVSRPIILWAPPPPESNLNPPSGECVEGKCKSGHGKFIWGSLDVYEGDWDDKIRPHGKGVYTWHDGESYDGDWVHGIKEGKGSVVFSCSSSCVYDLNTCLSVCIQLEFVLPRSSARSRSIT